MTIDMLLVFGLIVVAMVLFAIERVPFDIVALILMCALMLTGILDVKEGLSGFSNPATVTIAAMFILSRGVQRTGVLRRVGQYFSRLGRRSLPTTLLVIMAVVAVISAFINNTAAVVIFIPVLMATAGRMGVSPSKLLMPLSFAAMFGGVCTLLGTSTNILVSSIAEDSGLPPFSMFEFTPFGLIILVFGFAYLYIAAGRWVPARRDVEDITEDFKTVGYLSNVAITGDFDLLGRPLSEVKDFLGGDIEVLYVCRGDRLCFETDGHDTQEGDLLRIRGRARVIDELVQRRPGLEVRPPTQWREADLSTGDYELLEAVIAPNLDYDGLTVKELGLTDQYQAVILGAYKHGHTEREALHDIHLSGGDSLLLAVKEKRIHDLRRDDNFVIVSDVPVDRYRTQKVPVALGVLAGVILTAALGLFPIVVSAGAGVIVMVLTGCVPPAEVHKAINWKVIFLLAGVIPLGVAMQKTGAARLLSDLIVDTLGHLGPRAVLSGYFLLTMLLTALISNQATAAIFAALAIETANQMGVAARPFLMAVTFAASLSLITPWGYQTNTLIYGPGRYRFTDFTKVGAPLNLIFWILSTICIPLFWPF